MLASDRRVVSPTGWQAMIADSVTNPRRLLEQLHIPHEQVELLSAERLDFPLRVPQSFVDRMEPGNPRDPLLLQVLPLAEEANDVAGYTADPLAEAMALAGPGVVHKYRGRALLVTTGACAVNCRYCFRRHFPYADQHAGGESLDAALAYIRGDETLSEVILSGGDPLVLSDRQLSNLLQALAAIPHVQRLRIHSRVPVVVPQRMTAELRDILLSTRLQPVLVIHANHPREFSEELTAVLRDWQASAVTLLNQSVLLRGINDSAETLAQLSHALFRAGVLPYYLHLLDPVAGAAHFDVPEVEARELYRALLAELPGYLVPRLVRENPGAASKSPVAS